MGYLTNIPSPYRTVMVRAWARYNADLAISVYYTDQGDQGRDWGTEPIGHGVTETRLPILVNIKKYGKLNRQLLRLVRDNDIVMIGGFEQASYLWAAVMAKLYRKPVILLFDGFSPARFDNEPKAVVALKRITARLCQGFFANGTVGSRYLREKIRVSAGHMIYNQFLSHSEQPINTARHVLAGMDKAQIRLKLGIGDAGRHVLMSCGYLIHRKRIDLVIDAIAALPETERPLLLVVGTGELERELQTHAARRGVPAHFAGFKLGSELAEYYLAADSLVLASSDDPWGLVVNEAMSAGLPVVVSDACGASLDLVHPGINGWVFGSGKVNELTQALAFLIRADHNEMGCQSRSIIANWTPCHSATNLGKVASIVQNLYH